MATSATKRRMLESVTGFIFIGPAVALFLLLGLYTLIYGLQLSFVQWNGINPHSDPVGLQNYRDMFANADPALTKEVGASFVRTGIVMVVLVVSLIGISFPIAMALNAARRFKALLRTVFFLPYVTTGIAVFYAWRFILLPDGGLNALLRAVGLGSLSNVNGFLGDPSTAFASAIAILVWATVPLGIILYLAGLQSIDPSIVEAARIDGASSARLFSAVYWPLLRPVTALLVAIALRAALQEFQVFLLMTNGGPLDTSTTASLLSFQMAFSTNAQYGYASALGWVLFILGVLVSALAFAVLRPKDRA